MTPPHALKNSCICASVAWRKPVIYACLPPACSKIHMGARGACLEESHCVVTYADHASFRCCCSKSVLGWEQQKSAQVGEIDRQIYICKWMFPDDENKYTILALVSHMVSSISIVCEKLPRFLNATFAELGWLRASTSCSYLCHFLHADIWSTIRCRTKYVHINSLCHQHGLGLQSIESID